MSTYLNVFSVEKISHCIACSLIADIGTYIYKQYKQHNVEHMRDRNNTSQCHFTIITLFTIHKWDTQETSWFTFKNKKLCQSPLTMHRTISLSLSGACHEDVTASTSRRHAGLSIMYHLAVARPKLSGRRSSSTVLSQVCLGLPVLHRQSLEGPQIQARRAREWSWPVSARHRWPKDKCRWRISDRSGCPVRGTWPNHITGNKIRPMDMEDASETPIIQCIYLLLYGRGRTMGLMN